MVGPDDAVVTFELHRRRLTGLAYRMLGSLSEAEDIVQDAYLRWHAAERGRVDNPRAYLSRTVARLCLDHLKSARVRRTSMRACSPLRATCTEQPRCSKRSCNSATYAASLCTMTTCVGRTMRSGGNASSLGA